MASIAPESLIVYRVKGAGRSEPSPRDFQGRTWTGAEWVDYWRPALLSGKRRDDGPYALQDHNEVISTDNLAWWIDFEIARMKAWDAFGERTTYGNFAVGSFKPEHVGQLARLVEAGSKRGHILRFNTYWDDSNPGLFWYFKPLIDRFPDAPWFLGEIGWRINDAAYRGPIALRALMAQVKTIKHAGFKGGSLWVLTTLEDWKHSNVSDWRVVAENA